MEIPILILTLACCTYSLAGHSYIIPVENYETDLQVLDQQVDIPDPPVKIIKITKTVAVKIPVPYPVKVYEKVPYPVHISKPYPVPVPQIVHVPQPHQTYPKPSHEQETSSFFHGTQNQDSNEKLEQSFHGHFDNVRNFGANYDDGHGDEHHHAGFNTHSGDNEGYGSSQKKWYLALKNQPQKSNSNVDRSSNGFQY